MKQNPFSLYDFLGYLIPGSTLIYILLLIEKIGDNAEFNLNKIFKSVSEHKLQEVFLFIIISYSLGHILSFVSSITIEKYGNWRYGYPSKYILGFVKRSFWILETKPENYNEDIDIYDTCDNSKERFTRNFGRIFLVIFLSPFVIVDYIVGHKLNFKNFYQKGLDPYLTKVIKEKVVNLINSLGISETNKFKNTDLKKYDFHRIVTHYSFENCKEHQFRMVNYVALYGFLRNLVLIFILASWFYFILSLATINFKNELNTTMIFINLGLMTFSYISFMAYMKFYRRYTLEGLMLILVDKEIK
ncbi:hypothetical protein [uncultured Tenacibaculum sp.]|uniref:hypothetical protein n=1 Tax=uncultured Tenacibaculum sp. TaxID=174713 RepID=UPI00262C1183|nr:hypothetical protein [uncultured Tenacibaculum sp.]